MAFDVGKWHARVLSTPAAYSRLVDLAEHPPVAAEYKRSLYVRTLDDSGALVSPGVSRLDERIRDSVYSDALSAIDHYASLMVVTAATYVENIVFEFLVVYFTARPQSIHAHLMPNSSKREEAYVPLREVLAASSLSELHGHLARRASRNASDGSMERVFERIYKLTGHRVAVDVTAPIAEIVRLRNSIVHEGQTLTKVAAAIDRRFESVYSLLRELAGICKAEGLPYVDEGGLVDPLPFVEEELPGPVEYL
ncbi:TPA: hypothetical protein ACKP5I_000822 [Stenotrophomonas maltophilia]